MIPILTPIRVDKAAMAAQVAAVKAAVVINPKALKAEITNPLLRYRTLTKKKAGQRI